MDRVEAAKADSTSPAAVWTPLLPSLPSSIRFLAYNQRSYAQSSPAFDAKQPGGTDATAAYLCDLMALLRYAVDELGVRGIDEQTHEGGIVLLVRLTLIMRPLSMLTSSCRRAGARAPSCASRSSRSSTSPRRRHRRLSSPTFPPRASRTRPSSARTSARSSYSNRPAPRSAAPRPRTTPAR